MRQELGLSKAQVGDWSVSTQDLKTLPVVTPTELAKHNSREDCWVSIDNVCYDVTAWISAHPGGPRVLVAAAGSDVSAAFKALQHSDYARHALGTMAIARLAP